MYLTEEFPVLQRTRQGGTSSPRMYLTDVDDKRLAVINTHRGR